MKVRLYVTAVAVAAAAAAAYAGTTVPAPTHPTIAALVLFGLLIAVAESLQIRHYHHNQVDALNVMEGMLAPLILVSSGWTVVAVAAVALTIGDAIRANAPLKVVFNVSQWLLAASVASIVVHQLRPADLHSASALGALVLAMFLMTVVNQVALAGVLTVVAGSPFGSRGRETWRGVAAGHAISITGGLASGICLTAAYLWSPWTLLIGVLVIVGTHTAGRAFAAIRADGRRLASLQSATHALAAAVDLTTGLQDFLRDARAGFEVEAIELALFTEHGVIVHACSETAELGEALCVDTHPLAEAVAKSIEQPARFVAGDGSDIGTMLAGTRRNRVLAAPLRIGGTTSGVLFLYDRVGMEGFERGEVQIVDALAREVVGFLERATLLQAIDDERRKLADILGNTSDGIFSIAADGTVTSWNTGLVAMTGYTAEDVVGTRHFGMLRPRDAVGRDVLMERWPDLIESPGALPTDLQVMSSSGETVWLSCSFSRIPAGAASGDVLVVVARNVTQARELERLKDDFVAVVSHELRTPLVPIKGWAQTLLNRGDRLNDDQRRTAVQSILAQAQKLESLVLNILEASRIEAGRVDNEGVADVVSITARIVEDTLSSRPDRQIRLRPPSVPCQVKGSAIWVERSVSNLIANAIKYSPDEETVDVVIAADGDDVTVSVTDRGPGIPAEAQERIFDRFERLEETRKQTGTGLGLYITRRLARTMGGDVTVSSVPGAGSTFLLRLPMAPVSSTPVVVPEQRPTDKAVGENGNNVVRLH